MDYCKLYYNIEIIRPLSEPSVLKKKFDDIFSATKYTKALDNLKTLKKENSQNIKLDEQRLEFIKVECEKSLKVRVNILYSFH